MVELATKGDREIELEKNETKSRLPIVLKNFHPLVSTHTLLLLSLKSANLCYLKSPFSSIPKQPWRRVILRRASRFAASALATSEVRERRLQRRLCLSSFFFRFNRCRFCVVAPGSPEPFSTRWSRRRHWSCTCNAKIASSPSRRCREKHFSIASWPTKRRRLSLNWLLFAFFSAASIDRLLELESETFSPLGHWRPLPGFFSSPNALHVTRRAFPCPRWASKAQKSYEIDGKDKPRKGASSIEATTSSFSLEWFRPRRRDSVPPICLVYFFEGTR